MLKTLRRIIAWTGPYKRNLYAGCVCSFLMSWAVAAPVMLAAWMLGAVVDDARGVSPLDANVVWVSLGAISLCILVRFAFSYGKNRLQESIGYEVAPGERIAIGTILKRVPLGYFSQVKTGDVLTTATTELGMLELQGMKMVDAVINGYVNMAAVLVFLLVMYWPCGVAALAGVGVSSMALMGINRTSQRLTPKTHETTERAAGAIVEYVRGLGTAKSYGRANSALVPLHEACADMKEARIAVEWGFTPLNIVHLSALYVASVGVVGCAAWSSMQGAMPLWMFFALSLFSFTLFGSIERVNDSAHMLGDLNDVLDRLERIKDARFIDEEGREVALESYSIEFDHVSFSYEDGAGREEEATDPQNQVRPSENSCASDDALGNVSSAVASSASAARTNQVLHDVSFRIPQGTTCAIVGPSGSGKTTIANLMARFYDVDAGAVRIGGHDVRELTCDSLLSNFAMVFQNVYLFNDTVAANIGFGRAGSTRAEIEQAARRAQCYDFIVKLPQGFDTVVGEGGSALSGGQKQRISIARALLKDAPIVILDEATASVDPENEAFIQQALSELCAGKTVVVIAHRLATIESSDQILVVDGGRVVQRGTHDQLMAQEGTYRRFVEIRAAAEGWRITG